MFQSQPLRHAAVFAATIFCASIAAMALTLHRYAGHISFTFFAFSAAVLTLAALISGLCFWLGLCFSHRVPLPKRSAFCAVFLYAISFNLLNLFRGSVPAQWIAFGILLVFPFVFALRWPLAWSVASPTSVKPHAG